MKGGCLLDHRIYIFRLKCPHLIQFFPSEILAAEINFINCIACIKASITTNMLFHTVKVRFYFLQFYTGSDLRVVTSNMRLILVYIYVVSWSSKAGCLYLDCWASSIRKFRNTFHGKNSHQQCTISILRMHDNIRQLY